MERRGRKKKKTEQNTSTEQVVTEKKKRGRKKKWEVETTSKIFNTEKMEDVICFSGKNEKEQPTENYDTQNVSFGNLNITVHSNKDQLDTEKYKQLLSNNHEECKIIYSDTEEDYVKDEFQKISMVKNHNKIKTLKHYENIYSSGKEIIETNIRCFNCHHEFNNKPYFLPYEFHPKLKRYKVTGNFCSPNCVKTYALNSRIFSSKIYLIGQMYRSLYSQQYTIKPAPPINVLKCYGGILSINEYRANFINNIEYSLKNINCKLKSIDIFEKEKPIF